MVIWRKSSNNQHFRKGVLLCFIGVLSNLLYLVRTNCEQNRQPPLNLFTLVLVIFIGNFAYVLFGHQTRCLIFLQIQFSSLRWVAPCQSAIVMKFRIAEKIGGRRSLSDRAWSVGTEGKRSPCRNYGYFKFIVVFEKINKYFFIKLSNIEEVFCLWNGQ